MNNLARKYVVLFYNVSKIKRSISPHFFLLEQQIILQCQSKDNKNIKKTSEISNNNNICIGLSIISKIKRNVQGECESSAVIGEII